MYSKYYSILSFCDYFSNYVRCVVLIEKDFYDKQERSGRRKGIKDQPSMTLQVLISKSRSPLSLLPADQSMNLDNLKDDEHLRVCTRLFRHFFS